MPLLNYNEIKERRFIVLDGEPFEVLSSHVFRKQQRKPQNVTKLKNLITGTVKEHSFHASDKVPEAEIEEQKASYLYCHRDEYWFCETANKSNRFKLPAEQVSEQMSYLSPNSPVTILSFDQRLIGVKIPIKVELKVKEAAPASRGNTVQGGSKRVVLETGKELEVPMFINEGDIVIVNTDSGQYVERASKK